MRSMKRTLVTGGAGFIGSHLIDRLLARGDHVLCLDNFCDAYDPAEKRANIAAHLQHPRYGLIEADITDHEQLAGHVARYAPDVIVHLAARAGVRPSLDRPFLYERVNVHGTLSVLEAARLAGAPRLVFGSSSSVYGLGAAAPFCEGAPLLTPASPYAATKIAGEALCHSYAHLYPLQIASLRFFTVYGPRQRPDLAIRGFAERILRGKPIQLFGDGSSARDYTHVDDITAGVLAAIDRDHPGHELFNLGSAAPLRLGQLVEAIERAVGRPAIIERSGDRPGDVPHTFADLTRAAEHLGYAPRVDFQDGLRDFIAWLTPRVR